MEIIYRLCRADDAPAAAGLAGMLWPGCDQTELVKEYGQFISAGSMACPLALFRGEPIGFAQCQLRHDYVEGAHSSPVAYLEGILLRRHTGAWAQRASFCPCARNGPEVKAATNWRAIAN